MNGPGIFPAGLDRNGGVQCNAIETGEYLREKEQVLLRRDVPGEEKTGVCRRVEGSVEFPELFVSQVGNPLGIAPRVAGVRGSRIEVFLDSLVHQGLRGGVGPLHLVVDDPGDGQIAILGELQMVAFLEKGLPQQARPEDEIGIDPGEVEEVAFLLAGDGVDRLVGVGECVDEGLECSPEELVEDVLERVALGAGEDGMFEDMGDAGRIPGRRPEADGEEVFPVVAVEVKNLRPRPFMFDLIGGDADLRDLFHPQDTETVPLLAGAERWRRAVVFCMHDLSFPVSSLQSMIRDH